MPALTAPRATDGDERSEPDWEERFALTVGNRDADLIGADDRVLQAAVDSVARRGGGTVCLQPGTYILRNAVRLPSHLRLLGSGPETIITRLLSERVAVAGGTAMKRHPPTRNCRDHARRFVSHDRWLAGRAGTQRKAAARCVLVAVPKGRSSPDAQRPFC
jgi:hypothetical protein